MARVLGLLLLGTLAVADQNIGNEFQPYYPAFYPLVTGEYSQGPYQYAAHLSNDGFHQRDLEIFVADHPKSTLAGLLKNAIVYSDAKASQPSDSVPATLAIWGGATPFSSGVYWETVYDRELYPPGSNCTGPPGTQVDLSEAIDTDSTRLGGGGSLNLTALPQRKTSWGTCATVLPHEYPLVNNAFEVARRNGLETAFADKHLSYEFMNGPSGTGLSQGYFPEVASVSGLQGHLDWDDLHWSALKNWTSGKFTNGTKNPRGCPHLYGANFQTLNYAQSNYGYKNGAYEPTANISKALLAFDQKLGDFISHLKSINVLDDTLLMIGAKQGQGPIDPNGVRLIDPNTLLNATGVTTVYFTGEDGGLIWLNDSTQAAQAKANLLASDRNQTGVDYVFAGYEIYQQGYRNPYSDARAPDLLVQGQKQVLYQTAKTFEDHGGFVAQDLNVPLIAYNPRLKAANITGQVQNRQIAPTLLHALGLPLAQLDAYRIEGTPVLPGLFS